MFNPRLNIITPNCLSVDSATIFLKSHSVFALRPAIKVVVVATIIMAILKYIHLWSIG